MKLLVLAAGYATRLRPLTDNQAKPLLPVAGRPMLEHVLEKFADCPAIDAIYIQTANGDKLRDKEQIDTLKSTLEAAIFQPASEGE